MCRERRLSEIVLDWGVVQGEGREKIRRARRMLSWCGEDGEGSSIEKEERAETP